MRAALAVAAVLAMALACWFAFRDAEPPRAAALPRPAVTPAALSERRPPAVPEEHAQVPSAPQTPKPAPPPQPRLAVTGRIVDARFQPVAGATVAVCVEGGEPAVVVTDGLGRFTAETCPRAPAPAPTAGRLHAFSPAGDAAFREFRVAPDATLPFDAGTLQLSRSGSIDVRVTRDGAPDEGASVRLAIVPAAPGGYRTLCGVARARTDDQGRARFDHVPEGAVLVTAASDAGRGAVETVVHAERAAACEIALTRREVAVTVRADGEFGPPVAGARITAMWQRKNSRVFWRQSFDPPIDVPLTDSAGRTTLVLGAADEAILDVRADGCAPRTEIQVGAAATEVAVVLAATVTVRWPVVPGEVPPPADGSAIRLRPRVGSGTTELPRPGRMEGSNLVVEGVSPGILMAYAVAPDGSLALLHHDTRTITKEISFRRARSIDVRLTEDRMPIVGAFVLAVNPGNNPYGSPAVTDSAGHVVLGDFGNERQVAVYLVGRRLSEMGELLLGTVDLVDADARLEVDLPKSSVVVADVSVDGVRVLPADLWVAQTSGLWPDAERDESAATLTMRIRPARSGEPVVLTTNSPGCLQLRVEVPESPDAEPVRVAFALQRGGSLTGRVITSGRAPGTLRIERETASGWTPVPVWGTAVMPLRPDAEGGVRVDGVAPGRYRLRDEVTGASTAIEVAAGAAAAFAPLDLSRSGVMKLRVAGPDGATPDGCRVIVDGEGVDQSKLFDQPSDVRGVSIGRDGLFSVNLPGDRTVRVRAWHPTLVPAPEGGVVEVVEPRDGVVLRLVEGPTATMELRPAFGVTGRPGSARVLLFRGEPSGVPVCTPSASVSAGVLKLGAFEPGVYTMWIDAPNFAPVVVKDVELRAGRTDLPSVEIARGSRVRVKLLLNPGEQPAGVFVSVRSNAPPSYGRVTNESGTAEFTLTGFGPGKFSMTMGRAMGGARPVQREIELDGTNPVDVEWDLR